MSSARVTSWFGWPVLSTSFMDRGVSHKPCRSSQAVVQAPATKLKIRVVRDQDPNVVSGGLHGDGGRAYIASDSYQKVNSHKQIPKPREVTKKDRKNQVQNEPATCLGLCTESW